MAITLHLDTEQAALIDAALEFSVVALDQRAKRVDPSRILSDSAKLQSIKLEQVRAQFDMPPAPSFLDMSQDQKNQIHRTMNMWPHLQSDEERHAVLKTVIAQCEECRATQKRKPDTRATKKKSLPDP